jgi:hypothetical protein
MLVTGRRTPAGSIRALLLASLLAAGSSDDRAGAQPAAARGTPQGSAHAWDATAGMRVPGGTAALLAAAGLDPTRPRATALLDVIRVTHHLREGVELASEERRARVVGYIQTVAEFERAVAALPAGPVTLSLAETKNTRQGLEELAKVMGLSLEQDNRVYRVRPDPGAREQQRRAWLLAAGLDVAKVVAALNRNETVSLTLPADEVPLPLPEAIWRSLPAGTEIAGSTAASLLADRRASLLYYGAFAMDDETRRYLAAMPAVVQEIHGSDRFGAIALYGRSLRVRNGRIDPPGGEPAAALWEALADERLTRPDRFILRVLEKDGGRLALVYDGVAHLDAAPQAFALGLWMTDPGQRRDRFKAFYSACAPALETWDPALRPFARSLYDPVHMMVLNPAEADGRPGSLGYRRLWEKLYESDDLPDRPENELKNLERDGVVDAAWIADTVLPTDTRLRRERSETWLFGHRVFGAAPPGSLPQILVALRGYGKFRTLANTLERMGVTDPAVFALASRQAQRIGSIGDRAKTSVALALYQGALALVERVRLTRVIDAAAAGRLLTSLSRVALSDGGEFLGGVAFWIDAEFLPAVGRPAGSPLDPGNGRALETQVLAALSGRRADDAPGAGPVVEYEGTRYRIDPSVAELARLQAIRAKQGGASFDAEVAFAREVQAVAVGITDLAKVAPRVSALKAAAAPLVAAAKAAGGSDASDLAEAVADAAGALTKIRKPKDLTKTERIAVPLRRSIDRSLARTLMSLAYACSLGDADSTALVAGDPATRHDWGLLEVDEKVRARAPWVLPAETRDATGGWRVSGSVLALDIGLRDHALRRISADAMPDVPTITDNDRSAFVEAAVLANPFDYRDADMAAIADAIRRGRAKVAVLTSVPSVFPEAAASAALDEMRQQAVAWTLAHERERVTDFFSLGDLLRLGQLTPGTVEDLDAWGTSGLSFDGRLRLLFPASHLWSTLSGRRGKGLVPALVPDLSLLVAEALSDQRLPAALTRSILTLATLDYLDRLRVGFEDDWLAMVSAVQRILPARMDDYVAAVMTGGPLVPLAKGSAGVRVE